MTNKKDIEAAMEVFLDQLALMMEDEALWATFVRSLEIRRKKLKDRKMGYYINPTDMTKEEFLEKHGTPIDPDSMNGETFEDKLPVCLLDNGYFTAAGIAYDEIEFHAFHSPDGRPKKWFTVPRELLKPWYDKS